MIFSSIVFLLYFLPVVLGLYTLANAAYRKYILLGASILFYSWGAPQFIFVILLTTLLDFYLVKLMDRSQHKTTRRLLLLLPLLVNLGLLFYFKYFNFFLENLGLLLGNEHLSLLEVVMPIGISFYTFESITYVVDVYRKEHAPLQSFRDYLLYILFFPKLIAGPIVRFSDVADSLIQLNGYPLDKRISGWNRFCIGLAKKVLLANSLAPLADSGFITQEISTPHAWISMVAYCMQLYFDFSGYSDMAIGLARIFGIPLLENFNNPFVAHSFTDFWRRWHISLGRWMKHYLYIPLGGNKNRNNWRTYLNLGIVFLVSGLWHGASWNFLVWGAWHGFFMITERLIPEKWRPHWISIPLSQVLIALSFVLFRTETLTEAGHYYAQLWSSTARDIFVIEPWHYFYLGLALFFATWSLIPLFRKWQELFYWPAENKSLRWLPLCMLLFAISVAQLSASHINPFIYFRF